MTPNVKLDDGRRVELGQVLARAGEGTIYTVVDRDDLVAKVFHPELRDLAAKRAKIAAMAASPPSGVNQADGFIVLAWPLQLIDDAEVGYVMPRVDLSNAVEIHTISNPSNRANPLPTAPQWTKHARWQHLMNTAANLCLAVDTVHHTDAVIGDFQERNILVHDTTRVTLVDCDSMQFTGEDGRQFLCAMGRPEFTAPELAKSDLSSVARDEPSDLFALAIHIHLLLMAGNHPFLRGNWTGSGEQPDALTLARSGQWAGGPNSALQRHPLAPPVSFLPAELSALFVRAFTDGARDPVSRPSAAEWRRALLKVEVAECVRGHQMPTTSERCPWCDIDDERTARRVQREKTTNPDQVILRATPAPNHSLSSPRTPPAPGSAAPPTPLRSRNPALILAGVAVLVLLVIVAVVAYSAGGDGTGSSSSSPQSAATTDAPPTSVAGPGGTPPADAVECPGVVGGPYGHAATGSPITSCPFALNVAAAVNGSSLRFPATLQVLSPVTRQSYDMQCVVEQVLTCRGGNDAVVYVY